MSDSTTDLPSISTEALDEVTGGVVVSNSGSSTQLTTALQGIMTSLQNAQQNSSSSSSSMMPMMMAMMMKNKQG